MQIVFSDTPGVLKPNYKLQESMLNFSTSALADADAVSYTHLPNQPCYGMGGVVGPRRGKKVGEQNVLESTAIELSLIHI